MKRPSDEELVLHYYGESEDPEAVESALEDPDVARRWEALRAVLDAVPRTVDVPQRGAEYPHEVWAAIRGRLRSRGGLRFSGWPPPRGWPRRWDSPSGSGAASAASIREARPSAKAGRASCCWPWPTTSTARRCSSPSWPTRTAREPE